MSWNIIIIAMKLLLFTNRFTIIVSGTKLSCNYDNLVPATIPRCSTQHAWLSTNSSPIFMENKYAYVIGKKCILDTEIVQTVLNY